MVHDVCMRTAKGLVLRQRAVTRYKRVQVPQRSRWQERNYYEDIDCRAKPPLSYLLPIFPLFFFSLTH